MAATGGNATYSFSSAPKAVTARRKYREPNEAYDTTIYRDPKETCISWDKRVHRGNTYSMYTQKAIKDALAEAQRQPEKVVRRKPKAKEPSPFDMGLPELEKVSVDLTHNLVCSTEREPPIQHEIVETQTDELLPEAPAEHYKPQRTGVDVSTQVLDGELFDFDREVEPILNVIVNKTLEQAVMEVEEEHELAQMAQFKEEFYVRQEKMSQDWQEQVAEEFVRWKEKQAVVAQKRAEKERAARVLLKVQAVAAAKAHLASLVPRAMDTLKEVALPDMNTVSIDRYFMPQLLSSVQAKVREHIASRQLVADIIDNAAKQQQETRQQAVDRHYQLRLEIARRRYEDAQIRQGTLRIYMDDGKGGKEPVGPIQVSSEESLEAIHQTIFDWMRANKPALVQGWDYGVVLCIDGQPAQATSEIFEASAGQISMVPADPPPPEPEVDEEEGEEDEEGGEEEDE
mmetsp:Transcript_10823/g.24763  ORF Transcript_10823/g.24763 Transcript_10823/m.24763 type:complete len:457 (+) Transcript_10823:199-1569(+)|eukprot:CAMPEP_0178418094 /NCGR_PEP_ID=MMETSP0689_2-20121128/24911_1 /TAXON_ID=160604 /ORGANISM="Amphidinium massartii, Strain CS-259" /LENGTH=456 /DNA_ID=CAMNT_0020039477 /DNA_START=123 /DNA_END=1493 /DNA_ORIENTATION=+